MPGLIKGLATGIGSLPHRDADSALDLIFKYCPEIPFWPQLPKRDIREAMVAQFSEGFPFIEVSPEGASFRPEGTRDRELEVFYEKVIANDLEYFQISQAYAAGLYKFYQRLEKSGAQNPGFIKCQITGPFTFAASLKDEAGLSLLHNPVLMQAALKGLGMKAAWQVELFKKFAEKTVVFIDEPYLSCFGSAYTPVNREDVVRGLAELSAGIKQTQGALTGVHCCGNTDWSIFTEIKTIDIINFDAFGFLERFVLYADNLDSFIKRGGIICWGVVPTQEFTGRETPAALAGRIKQGIDILAKKGLEQSLLADNLLISPSCGLGTLEAQKSEAIFKLLSEVSAVLRK